MIVINTAEDLMIVINTDLMIVINTAEVST